MRSSPLVPHALPEAVRRLSPCWAILLTGRRTRPCRPPATRLRPGSRPPGCRARHDAGSFAVNAPVLPGCDHKPAPRVQDRPGRVGQLELGEALGCDRLAVQGGPLGDRAGLVGGKQVEPWVGGRGGVNHRGEGPAAAGGAMMVAVRGVEVRQLYGGHPHRGAGARGLQQRQRIRRQSPGTVGNNGRASDANLEAGHLGGMDVAATDDGTEAGGPVHRPQRRCADRPLEVGIGRPLSSTGPISTKDTGAAPAASTTSWLTRTSPGWA